MHLVVFHFSHYCVCCLVASQQLRAAIRARDSYTNWKTFWPLRILRFTHTCLFHSYVICSNYGGNYGGNYPTNFNYPPSYGYVAVYSSTSLHRILYDSLTLSCFILLSFPVTMVWSIQARWNREKRLGVSEVKASPASQARTLSHPHLRKALQKEGHFLIQSMLVRSLETITRTTRFRIKIMDTSIIRLRTKIMATKERFGVESVGTRPVWRETLVTLHLQTPSASWFSC